MPGNLKSELPKFLDGWKEIATYLGKGVRTVQRYEREMGLPVGRPAGKSRASVIATKVELDAWVAASPFRSAFLLPSLPSKPRVSAAEFAQSVDQMRRLRAEMFDLRRDLRKSVDLLKESIHSAHTGVNYSRRNRKTVPDFDSRDNAVFNLAETPVDRKVH